MALVYIISFFKEMLNYADKNKLTAERICEVMCECLVGEDKLMKNTNKFRRESLVRAATMLNNNAASGGLRRTKSPTKGKLMEHLGGLDRKMTMVR